MKFIASFLFIYAATILCGSFSNATSFTSPRDTTNRYIINNTTIHHFDGSQLVGKKILSYKIAISSNGITVVKTHYIEIDGEVKPASPVIVIDGRQSTQEEYAKLDPSMIKNVFVIKNVRQEEYKQYEGWENGVILIQTKKGE